MIFERIQSTAETLTPAEQKLVRELLARPRDAALGTAGELARRIGVHEATASRLAKKLGFDSYALFRDAMRQEFIVRTDPALRVKNTLAASAGSLLGEVIAQEQAGLANLSAFVPQERLEAAAATLVGARKIFVFARGNAEALAVLADRRLRRMGLDVVVLAGDARDLAERLSAIGKDDALLAFAFRRAPRHWRTVLDHAQACRAASVVVADTIGPSLAPAPTHLLFAPRPGSPDAFQTLTVPMTIVNALVLQMMRFDETRSLERLESVGRLLAIFEDR